MSTNSFAITLLYYHLYARSKLTPDLLSKVVKKYKKAPSALLDDLVKKYEFSLPECVNASEIHRLVGVYNVPSEYIALMGSLPSSTAYSPTLDIYSDQLNAEKAISSGILFAPNLNVPALDNLSRAAHLLPNYDGPVSRNVTAVPSSSSGLLSAELMISGEIGEGEKSSGTRRSCFDTIAELSTRTFHSHDLSGSAVHIDSPLALLYSFMRDNVRVRILIRRKGCVRGSLDCYVKAFDKHFNMILRDVDEEYITNQQAARAVLMGRFKNRHNVFQRHLPQLLLRGDNVVMICKVPSSNSTASSSSSSSSDKR